MRNEIKSQLLDSAKVKKRLSVEYLDVIEEAAVTLLDCIKSGHKVLLCGNGGSAADAQHLAAEMVVRLRLDRKPIRAISLTTDTSLITAMTNDYGFEDLFARQVEALGDEGDVLIGITTSGNSENVIRAVKKAKQMGLKSIVLTGKGGGRINNLADIMIIVPSNDVQRIQESHITIGHILCDIMEKGLFG
ncbi:MAG: D-sedoheptulose 7-phosphate isomerase [Candidatus Marinimicrobia bacterium]|nr:D-sedoheptulose 7-phosphate isomerase [Candidatus Neomarinimicrobiota bacterium]